MPSGSPTTDARVRFTLTAATTARENTKGDARYFFPLVEQVTWESEQCLLLVPFEYRLPTEGEAAGQTTAKLQETLLGGAVNGMVERIPDAAVRATLLGPDPTRHNDDESLLLRRLRHFTRRNTTDYFIHRDLGGFLRDELAFYLKDQVVQLADLDGDLGPRQRMLRVIRELAGVVIDFLAELEDAQRRLFEKRKFVLRTDYLVTMRCIPRDLWPRIAASELQLQAWKDLFLIEPTEVGTDETAFTAFFELHPTLLVDTRYFDEGFRDELLASFEDLDGMTDGVLVHGENYQALRLLGATLAGNVKCVYIDPPYNTGTDGFIYKDRYRHSSWLAMMDERIRLALPLLARDAPLLVSLNDIESSALVRVADELFPRLEYLGPFVWKTRNTDNRILTRFSVDHDYIHVFVRRGERLLGRIVDRSSFKNPDDDPRGPYTTDPLTGKANAEARPNLHYSITNPMTGDEYPPDPDFGWITDREGFERLLGDNRVYWPANAATGKPRKKRFLFEASERAPVGSLSIAIKQGEGNLDLAQVLGFKAMNFPKPVSVMRSVIESTTGPNDVVLDHFAGSGTTGQAVIDLNRKEGTYRKLVLVEVGDYFADVLVPRLSRVTYSPEWSEGSPVRLPSPEEVAHTPRVMKIVRLEAYEDSLHNVEMDRNRAGLEGLLNAAVDRSSAMLNAEWLAHPFEYEIESLTDDGPRRQTVDLVETFNLVYGVHVDRIQVWTNDADGRRYRAITGRKDGDRLLIVWRDTTDLDPAVERRFLEERIEPGAFREVLINGDAAVPAGDGRPAVRSLDPIFKRLIEEEDR